MAAHRLSLLLTGAVHLGACGGAPADGLTAEEAAVIDDYVGSDLSLSEQQCILEGLTVMEIDLDRLVAEDLTVQEEGGLLAVVSECLDDPASADAVVDAFIAGAEQEGTTLTRDEARCAIRALEQADDQDAILACLDDDTIESIEDTTVALLEDQCRRGNNQACDELFLTAAEGSEAADYGRTCGNRLPDGTGLSCFDSLG